MSGPTAGEVKELTESLSQLIVVVGRLADPGSSQKSNSAATVNVNAGGLGVIVAVGACMLMLAVNVMQLADRTRMDNEIRELRAADKRHDDYLNAIYRRQPDTKPEEKQ